MAAAAPNQRRPAAAEQPSMTPGPTPNKMAACVAPGRCGGACTCSNSVKTSGKSSSRDCNECPRRPAGDTCAIDMHEAEVR
eukprot:CAMPEP_0119411374 /NCGR_PEP_ID=MMETSP1335-20130426/4136_1 /TAXON_ID=259385 /ORGANISM="Chrysoculter rhomboideus, Strain RCC1486" /LENGTH=80 /DNA_ID=CAMNT_0007436003 /DNA_START=390 /DNA_END=632 /DNA_ORIENTATION=-